MKPALTQPHPPTPTAAILSRIQPCVVVGEQTITSEAALAWLLYAVAGTAITIWLVRRLWKGATSATKRVAALVAGSAVGSIIVTLLGLVKLFGAVGGVSVDPSQQARILAEGSSGAMNFLVFGALVWLPSVVAAWVILRSHGTPRRDTHLVRPTYRR